MKFKVKKGKSWLSATYPGPSLIDDSVPLQFESSDKYQPKHLTKGQSRRMSLLSKMTVDLSLDVAAGEKIDKAIFASRHGELGNSTHLIDLITESELLSPTKFTQSVHNTSSGLFSILSENKSSSVSISAGENSFIMGLVSVYTHLQVNPHDQILFVFSDCSLPERYKSSTSDGIDDHVMALIFNNDSPVSFEIKPGSESNNTSSEFPFAVDFISWLSGKDEERLFANESLTNWVFTKCI